MPDVNARPAEPSQKQPQAAADLDEGANPTLAGQGAEGAEAARVPESMLADEAASNAAAGANAPGVRQ
jgi:hypothetical protein